MANLLFEFVSALIFGCLGDPKEAKGSYMGQPKLYFGVPIIPRVIGQTDVDPKPPPPPKDPLEDPNEPKGSHMGQPKLYFWVPSFCPITSSVIGQKDVDPKPPPPQRTP